MSGRDIAVVSGAAGAVGSIAGQIARIKGARVIGIAGGPEKPGGSSSSSTSDAITALAPEED